MAGDEGGAGDDFVADLLEGVKEIVGLCTELHPPAPLVLVVGGGARLNQEANWPITQPPAQIGVLR